MIGALLSFSAMAVSIRELSATLGIMEILSARAAIGLLISRDRPTADSGLYAEGLKKVRRNRGSVHHQAAVGGIDRSRQIVLAR